MPATGSLHAPMILRIKKARFRLKLAAGLLQSTSRASCKLWLANVFGDGQSRLRVLEDILPQCSLQQIYFLSIYPIALYCMLPCTLMLLRSSAHREKCCNCRIPLQTKKHPLGISALLALQPSAAWPPMARWHQDLRFEIRRKYHEKARYEKVHESVGGGGTKARNILVATRLSPKQWTQKSSDFLSAL